MPDKNYVGGKLQIGYVGAFTYAEVISGYTSWYLGVKMGYEQYFEMNGIRNDNKSEIEMQVQFTGSWYDEAGEKTAANLLIDKGCALISQHADSMGAPTACETAGVPNVSYNGSTANACPNTFVISSRINWVPYYKYMIDCVRNDKEIAKDWSEGLGNLYAAEQGAVAITELGGAAVAASEGIIGTDSVIYYGIMLLKSGWLKVFDCSTFTVTKTDSKNQNATVDANGYLTAYQADVNTDEAFTPDTNAIKTENGITYFAESVFRSAPYFDVQIDGINLLNKEF